MNATRKVESPADAGNRCRIGAWETHRPMPAEMKDWVKEIAGGDAAAAARVLDEVEETGRQRPWVVLVESGVTGVPQTGYVVLGVDTLEGIGDTAMRKHVESCLRMAPPPTRGRTRIALAHWSHGFREIKASMDAASARALAAFGAAGAGTLQ